MWKDIIGFEGLYQIDEFGNILSLKSQKLLSPYLNNKGYKCIDLVKDKKKYKFTIHRLVAEHYVENPNNYPIVLHLDNNKINTHYSNLKWGTYSENNAQAIHDGLNKVPRPDNTRYYEIYNPITKETKIFKGLSSLISENGWKCSDSAFRNFLSRKQPISNGKYKGCYIIRVRYAD